MEATVRRPVGRLVLIPFIAAILAFGWLAYANTRSDAPPAPQLPKVDLGDLMFAATAAKGIYLQYDGVTGPASTSHTNHAPANSFAWSATRPVPVGGTGGGTSKLTVADFTLKRTADKFSLPFLKLLAEGKHQPTARIYLTNAPVQGIKLDYIVIEIAEPLITAAAVSTSGGVPTETLSINAAKIKITSRLNTTTAVVSIDMKTGVVT